MSESDSNLLPTKPEERIIGTIGYTIIMISLTIATSIFFLGWISNVLGLSLIQTIVSSLIGSGIVAILLCLNGHAGVKYGIPYPIYLRLSFGKNTTIIPMIMVVFIDIIWYAIDAFIATWAITEMFLLILGYAGIDMPTRGLYYVPFVLILFLIITGVIGAGKIKSIKWLDILSGPLILLFFGWFTLYMMNMPQFSHISIPIWEGRSSWLSSEFLLNIAVQTAWWGMIVPNIVDICRFTKSTKSLIFGHTIGLVIPQVIGTIIGYIATYITGGNLSPIDIIAIYSPIPIIGIFGLLFAFLATATTMLTGYLPGIVNVFAKVFKLSWRKTIIITSILSFFIAPWYVKESLEVAYKLIDIMWYYSMFLGPIVGIMITDYWIVRKRIILINEIYHKNPFNSSYIGIISLIIGIIAEYILAIYQGKLYYVYIFPLPGLELVWYYGLIISSISYYLLSIIKKK
ncbi:MAG: cytosine permease [Candidatus Verstraetearchaeota archaeon]|nr:cytosine permease [Candidatus Verstraetearchaeota archaeon]